MERLLNIIHNYSITYQDGDSEVMSHSNVLKYVKGTKEYEFHL